MEGLKERLVTEGRLSEINAEKITADIDQEEAQRVMNLPPESFINALGTLQQKYITGGKPTLKLRLTPKSETPSEETTSKPTEEVQANTSSTSSSMRERPKPKLSIPSAQKELTPPAEKAIQGTIGGLNRTDLTGKETLKTSTLKKESPSGEKKNPFKLKLKMSTKKNDDADKTAETPKPVIPKTSTLPKISLTEKTPETPAKSMGSLQIKKTADPEAAPVATTSAPEIPSLSLPSPEASEAPTISILKLPNSEEASNTTAQIPTLPPPPKTLPPPPAAQEEEENFSVSLTPSNDDASEKENFQFSKELNLPKAEGKSMQKQKIIIGICALSVIGILTYGVVLLGGKLFGSKENPAKEKIANKIKAPIKKTKPPFQKYITDGLKTLKIGTTYKAAPICTDGRLKMISTKLTVEMWLKIPSHGEKAVTLLEIRNNNNVIDKLFLNTDGALCFASNASFEDSTFVSFKKRLTENNWFHVAGIMNRNTLSLYINGKKRNELSIKDKGIFTRNALFIAPSSKTSDPRGIWIDEILISNNIKYTANFIPERHLNMNNNSIAYFPFEELAKNKFGYYGHYGFGEATIGNSTWQNDGEMASRIFLHLEKKRKKQKK